MDVTMMRERLKAMDVATRDSQITIVDRKLGGVLPHMAVGQKTRTVESGQ
jgi:hypothetical protein